MTAATRTCLFPSLLILVACAPSPGERRVAWVPPDDALPADVPGASPAGAFSGVTQTAGTYTPGGDDLPWADTGLADDADGVDDSDVPELPPDPGVAPTCAILTPPHAVRVPAGTAIPFAGSVDDADGDVVYTLWTSNLWGPMVYGTAFPFILPPGVHEVAMTVVDAHGHVCVDAVVVTVDP